MIGLDGISLGIVKALQNTADLIPYLLLCLSLAVFGVYPLYMAFRSSQTIEGTLIEVRGVFQVRSADIVKRPI